LPLKSALERRRYDWQWHAKALLSIMKSLHNHADPDFVCSASYQNSPGFLTAALTAAHSAGFHLDGFATQI
jgi:hypothetical protein